MRAKIFLVAFIVLVSVGAALLDYSHHAAPAVSERTAGAVAPDFTFQTLDGGKTHHLRDFRGKTILVNFWASWCLPCRHEFPLLLDLAKARPDRFALIMLSVDEDPGRAAAFVRDFPRLSNLYIAWDKDKRIAQEMFQTVRYPESVLIGPDFVMKEKIVGALTEANVKSIRSQVQP